MTTINFPELKELEGKIDERRKQLRSIFDEAGPDRDMTKVKCIPGGSAAVVLEVRKLNDELDELSTKHAENLAVLKGAQQAARSGEAWDDHAGFERGADGRPTGRKSFGQATAASAVRTTKNVEQELDVELKTLFTRSAGWAPESTRSGLVVPYATRPVQVTDLLPTVPWGQAAYKYMEETTFTNNAAERAEGGTYGEAAFALTERSVTVETIGVWIPVTDEQLEDEEHAAAYLDMRMPFLLAQRLDGQILNGDGSTPNILGVNNKGSIQTQAKGTDPVFDTVLKGAVKVRVTGRAFPNAVVFHPNDWQDLRLTRTADGIYILGNPADAAPTSIWGLRPVESDAQTENTAIVGDFTNFSMLVMRRGVLVERTNAHDTYFINGKQAIRAGVRCATVWTRAAAFCQLTGI